MLLLIFLCNSPALAQIDTFLHTISLHDALPIFHSLASLVDLAPSATSELAGDLRLVQRYQLRLLGPSLRVGDPTISGRPSCLHVSQLLLRRLLPLLGTVQQLLLRPERHDPQRGDGQEIGRAHV